MNKCYSKVWNAALGQVVVASELASSDTVGVVGGACSSGRPLVRLGLVMGVLLAAFGVAAPAASVFAADAVCVDPANTTTPTPVGNTAAAGDQVACGQGATAASANSVAIGTTATAGIANGTRPAVAIGNNARALGFGSVALGNNAYVSSGAGITQGNLGVAIGDSAVTTGYWGVAIGNTAEAGRLGDISIGFSAGRGRPTSAKDNIAIGTAAGSIEDIQWMDQAFKDRIASMGGYIGAMTGEMNVALGSAAQQNTRGSYNVAIAEHAGRFVDGNANQTIGRESGNLVKGDFNTSIGNGAGNYVAGHGNTTIGKWSDDKSYVLNNDYPTLNTGGQAIINGSDNVAQGSYAGMGVTGNNNIAMGTNAGGGGGATWSGPMQMTLNGRLTGSNNIAIGNKAGTGGGDTAVDNSIAMGNEAIATKNNAIALGNGAKAKGESSISIGTGNTVNGDRSGAIGDPTIIDGTDSYSVGNNNNIATGQNDVFAFGNDITKTVSNSVALGSNAAMYAAKAVTGMTIRGTAYTYAGGAPVGVVSVGDVGKERQIQNVAAGQVNATSTDAVNGSQLYATTTALENLVTSSGVKYFSVNSTGGTNEDNKGATGADAIAIGKNASSTVAGATAVGLNSKATGTNSISLGASTAAGADAIALGRTANGGGANSIAVGVNTNAGANSVAIGVGGATGSLATQATGQYSIAIGRVARAFNDNAIAIGQYSASTSNGVGIGWTADANQDKSVAIGYNTYGGVQGVQVGVATTVFAGGFRGAFRRGSTLVGYNAESGGLYSTVMGSTSGIMTNQNIKGGGFGGLFGTFSTQGAFSNIFGAYNTVGKVTDTAVYNSIAVSVVGSANTVTESNGVFIGGYGNTVNKAYDSKLDLNFVTDSSSASIANLVKDPNTALGQVGVIGAGNTLDTANNTFVVGIKNKVDNSNLSQVSGFQQTASKINNSFIAGAASTYNNASSVVGMGTNQNVGTAANTAKNSILIGDNINYAQTTSQQDSIAIGNNTESATGAVAVGVTAKAKGDYSIAVGYDAIATGSIATGKSARAGNGGAAYGDGATATYNGGATDPAIIAGVAVGQNAIADISGATALGTSAKANVADSVALGSSSVATIAAGIAGYDLATGLPSTDTTSTWVSTRAAVSVGDVANGITRQITSVAAGAADTDAVNVAQLKQAVSGAASHYYSVNDNGVQGGNYDNDGATGINAIAAGVNASATGGSAIAMGTNATASGAWGSIAMGGADPTAANPKAHVNEAGKASIAIGFGANANPTTGNDKSGSTAIGTYASTGDGGYNTSLGYGSTSKGGLGDNGDGTFATALGAFATADGAGATAVGVAAKASAKGAVALGVDSLASHEGSVALGAKSVTAVANATPTGVINGVTYNYAGGAPVAVVSVGTVGGERQITNVAAGQVTATSTDAINGSQLYATNQAIEATQGKLTHYYSVNDGGTQKANYNNDGATGVDAMAAGVNASATGSGAVAVGANATANGAWGSVAVGGGVAGKDNIAGKGSVAVGFGSQANPSEGDSSGGSAFGTYSNTGKSSYNTALGYKASADGTTVGDGSFATAVGAFSNAKGTLATAVGSGAAATADQAITVGAYATNAQKGAIVIGDPTTQVGGEKAVAVGMGANAAALNDVAVGAGSTTGATTAVNSATVGGITYGGFAGNTPDSAFAVGSAGKERQVQHVAAGRVDASSTDAINGSQLYATNKVIDTFAQSVAAGMGPDSTVGPDGELSTVINVNGTAYNNVEEAIQTVNDTASAGWNLSANGGTPVNIAPGATVDLKNTDGNIVVTQDPTTGDASFDLADTIKIGGAAGTTIDANGVTLSGGSSLTNTGLTMAPGAIINMGGNVVTGVAPGALNVTSTDAVNGSQLYATNVNVTNAQNTADTALATANKGIKFGDGSTSTQYALGDTINVKGDANVKSVTTADGVQLSLGDVVTVGGAAPVVINGETGTIGGLTNTTFDPNNFVSGQAATEDQLAQVNTAAVQAKTTVTQGENMVVTKTTNADGSDNYQVATAKDVTFDTVQVGDIKVDGATNVISGLAPGALAADSTDAVNGSQLFQTNNIVNNLGSSTAAGLGGGSAYDPATGTVTTVLNVGGNTYNNVNDALGAINTSATAGWNLTANSGANGTNVAPGGTVDLYNNDGNIIVTKTDADNNVAFDLAKDLNVDSVTAGNTKLDTNGMTTTDGTNTATYGPMGMSLSNGTVISTTNVTIAGGTTINMGNNIVSGVAAGVADTDAVNVSQLKAVAATSGKSTVSAGNNTVVTTTTNADGTTNYQVGTSNNVAFDTVKVGNVNIDGATGKISGVTAGDISANSTDAVNGSQLYATNQKIDQVSQVANAGWNISTQGKNATNVKPGASVDMKNTDGNIIVSKSTANNDINFDLAKNIKVDSVVLGNGTTTINQNGLIIQNGPSVTANGGINAGGMAITNVKAGTAPTDAVNVSQLQAATGDVLNQANSYTDVQINGVRQDLWRVDRGYRGGTASAMAMATLPQAYIPGKSMASIAASHYEGESGLAVGVSGVTENGRIVYKLNTSGNTTGQWGVAVGAGLQW